MKVAIRKGTRQRRRRPETENDMGPSLMGTWADVSDGSAAGR